MCKCRFTGMAILMFFAFSILSAQETQTQPKKPKAIPVNPGEIEVKPGGGIEFKPPQISEEDKAYQNARQGDYTAGIEFLKKYPDDYRKTQIINQMLKTPVDAIGFNGYMPGKLRLTPDWKHGLFWTGDGRYMLLNMETSLIEKVYKRMGGSKFSPDGKLLIGIGSVPKPTDRGYPYYTRSGIGPTDFNGVITIYSADDGSLVKHIEWKLKNEYEQAVSVDFTKDSKKILSCSRKAVALWDYETGKQIVEYSVPNAKFKVARISDDNKYIACAGSEKSRLINKYGDPTSKGCLYIWDIEKKEPIYSCLEDVNEINEICFSPDGKWLASTTADNRIVVRDAKTGEHFYSFEGHKTPANRIIFTPDSKLMISSNKYKCRIWDIEGRKQRRVIHEIKNLDYVKFEDDFMLVADQYTRWRVSLKDQYQTLNGPDGEIFDACYSSDGKMFAAGSSYGKIRIWDAATKEKLIDIHADTNSISELKFMSDNKSIVCCTYGGKVMFFNVSDGTLIKELQAHEDRIYGMDISSDDKYLATASEDKTAKVWNVSDLSLIKTITEHRKEVHGVSFSANCKHLATGSHDTRIYIWNTEDWSLYESSDLTGKVNHVKYAPNSKEYFYSGDSNGIGKRNSVGPNKFSAYFNYHTSKARRFSISKNGKLLASTSTEKYIYYWDLQSREDGSSSPQYIFEHNNDRSNAVCFSPDGNTLLTGDYDFEWDNNINRQVKNSKIRLWDLNTIELTKQYVGPRGNAYNSDISSDGKYIAYAYYDSYKTFPNNVEIWSMKTGACLLRLDGHEDTTIRVKFSPDGKILASGSRGKYKRIDEELYEWTSEIKLWNAETGELLRTIETDSTGIWNLEFSPDGKYIVASGGSSNFRDENGEVHTKGELCVWEVETGTKKFELSGHSPMTTYTGSLHTFVHCAKFTADGKHIVSLSSDYIHNDKDKFEQYRYNSEMILWNAETGEQVYKIRELGNKLNTVDFTLDGKHIITGESKKIGYNEKDGNDINQGFINFRSIENGEIVRTLTVDDARSMTARISPDGKTILSHTSYKFVKKHTVISSNRLTFWDIESGEQYTEFEPYRSDHGSDAYFTPDGNYIIVNGSYLYLTLNYIESKVGKENLYKHMFTYNSAVNPIVTSFGYSKNGFEDDWQKIFNWEAIAKNYPDKTLSEVQELISMERMRMLLWYFDMVPVGLEGEEWLTEKDGVYYATCKFKMRHHSRNNVELDEWFLTVKARLNKKAFTWQIVDMGNFPLDLMGLSKITIKYKDLKEGYWMAQDFLVTPKQREALEAKLKENPEYIPQEYYVEFYSRGSSKRLEKLDK